MKLKLLGLAALAMLACVAVPASAQMKGDGAKAAKRSVMIKEKYEAGLVITEKSTEDRSGKLLISAGGQDSEGADTSHTDKEESTEVLAVGDASGDITDGRLTCTKEQTKKSEQKPGEAEMGAEEVSKGDMEGVTIRYTWDVESKGFKAKLEKGEDAKDTKDVIKALAKKQPFKVPFIPGKEVAVGDSWEIEEAKLREFVGEDEKMKVTEIKATCKFESIDATKAGDVAKVTFTMTVKGTVADDQLGELPLEGTTEGHYLFDLTTSRCTRVEIKTAMGFEKEVKTPQGNVKVTYKMTGTEVKELTYAKKDGK
jgi:hypothetical protein